MEVWFPDGNGGRKLVNMAGTAAADTEEQTDETPALRTTALSRAAPLLASAGEDAEDDEAREIYYPDRDGGRVLLSSGSGITSLPTASQTVKGAVMIGNGLAMNGDTLNVSLASSDLPIASTVTRGAVRIGNGLVMNGDVLNATAQNITLPVASDTTAGVVKVGNGLAMVGDTLNVTVQSSDDGSGSGCCCGNVYFAGSFSEFPTGAPRGWLVFVNNKAYIYNGATWLPICTCGGGDTTSGGGDTTSGGDDTTSGGDDTTSGGEFLLVTANPTNASVYALTEQGVSVIGNLQQAATTEANGEVVTNYKIFVAAEDSASLTGTIPNTNDYTKIAVTTTDYDGNVWLYDFGTHSKVYFYPAESGRGMFRNESNDINGTFFTDTQLIAHNVDSIGNHFEIVLHFEKVTDKNGEIYPVETSVEILQNGQTVQTVPLAPFATSLLNEVPAPEPLYQLTWHVDDPYEYLSTIEGGGSIYTRERIANGFHVVDEWATTYFRDPNYGASLYYGEGKIPVDYMYPGLGGICAFIESAQNWYFWVRAHASKEGYNLLATADYGLSDQVVSMTRIEDAVVANTKTRLYLVTANGATNVSEIQTQDTQYFDTDEYKWRVRTTRTRRNTQEITVPMQDGYYYTASGFCSWLDFLTDASTREDCEGYVAENRYAVATVYTPTGETVFSRLSFIPAKFMIHPAGNGYIFADGSEGNATLLMYLNSCGLDTYNGVRGMDNGWYRVVGGELEKMTVKLHGDLCTQRLRPMHNIAEWYKHLRLLNVTQNELS